LYYKRVGPSDRPAAIAIRRIIFESSFRVEATMTMLSIRYAAASAVRAALLIWAFAIFATTVHAQEADAKATDRDDASVPVKRVVLFNSGVGYIEHRGKIEGDASVDLKFDVEDVNDLLKSMVLQDLSGGQISTVTYGSRDPINKTLQTFAIDLTRNPSLGDLLSQIRGERIEIDAPTKLEGTIVGVEVRDKQVDKDEVIKVEYLNILTEEGLRRIALDSVGRIKLASKELDKELREALSVLAKGHATDKKTVTLKFLGEGQRDVRVGYIQEAPVWKTSYRLVLPHGKEDDGKPFLQGWAIVENTSDTDWEDVELSFVSGRPISFVMDLYSPLYAQRPTIVPELFSSLRPQMYEQDLASRNRDFFARGQLRSEEQSKSLQESESKASAGRRSAMGGFGGGVGGEPAGDMAYGMAGTAVVTSGRSAPASDSPALSLSGTSAAQGGDVGELFQYDINMPVTLARQRSAMLPIVNDSIEGEKVSIYNPSVHAKHPLNGVELKNSSKLHLMQGPVTVFDGGVYAGDARIPDLPPGTDRLISYALDLDVEIAPTSKYQPQDLLSVRLEKGVLIATHKQSRTQKYIVKNSSGDEKRVLIEYGFDPQWKLIEPKKPTERTRDMYRFAVKAEPGKPAELKIEEQQDVRQDVAVTSLGDDAIRLYLHSKVVSEAVKEALREVSRRKNELGELQRQKQLLDHEVATIDREQQRMRENMKSIDRNTDLYNRYVKKLTDQEDRIETIRGETQKLDAQIAESQRSLDQYLSELNLG
jgi:hypothetical protein